ncbi:MAG: transposase [Chloroflexi bacterium]|nr:transposase [Chloroflexota bacterium]
MSDPIVQASKTHTCLYAHEAEAQQSPGWRSLYAQRPSVERAFSRLKGQRFLNHIRVRRLRKVTAHCYLALIAMQAVYRHK